MTNRISSALAAATLVLSFATSASAQQPPTVRIRGTIEKVDGNLLTIKAREGDEKMVKMTDNIVVTGIAKMALADIKPGSYIGVSGQP